MKKIFGFIIIITTLSSCTKDNVLFNDVQIKIIHRTCVQTVASIVSTGIPLGETWVRNGVSFDNCFNVGVANQIQIDSVNQIIRVTILSSGTGPQVICAMVDVKGTNKLYDVIQR